MKIILQILGIATFFVILAYSLTYPYELSYSGTDDIILIEDSYGFTSLTEIIDREEFNNKVLYIDLSEPWDITFDKEMRQKYEHIPKLVNTYKIKAVEFVYLIRPDSESELKKDEIRKWKVAIKELHHTRGYHIVMSKLLFKNILNDIPEIKENHYLPHYLIVNKKGDIVNLNAPPPFDKTLYTELDRLLKEL